MGKFMSKLHNLLADVYLPTPCRILMLGLDPAGKTTILYKSQQKENVNTVPTMGFNVETIHPVKGVRFTVWDVCGKEKMRRLWKHYFQNVVGIMFVVDSSDRDRLEEARDEFSILMNYEELKNVPFVIIANKQDLPNALSPSEMADGLDLHKLVDKKWSVKGSSGLTGEGVFESMQTMANLVLHNRNTY